VIFVFVFMLLLEWVSGGDVDARVGVDVAISGAVCVHIRVG